MSLTRRGLVSAEHETDEPAHQFILHLWDLKIKAIIKIQRAFRKWRQQCLDVGWISHENPYHWIHWRQFRRQYGWTTYELYDEYGEVRQRTDGGRPSRRCRPEHDTIPLERHDRYADAIGNYKALYGKLPLDGDETLIALLQESGVLDMTMIARVLATRWWRMKDRNASTSKGKPEPTNAVKTSLGSVMLLHTAVVRDLKTSLNFANGLQKSQVFQMLGMFNKRASFTQNSFNMRDPRDDTVQGVVQGYITSLEDSIRWTYAPPDPPSGLPDGIADIWLASKEAVYHENQPRVCRLRKFGRRWLKAVQDNSKNKAALIRPRSAGTLGLSGAPHIDCSKRMTIPTLRPDGGMEGHLQMLVDQQRALGIEGVKARALHCKNTAWMDGLDWESIAAAVDGRAPTDYEGRGQLDTLDFAEMMDDMMDPEEGGQENGYDGFDEDEDDDEEEEGEEGGAAGSSAHTPSPPATKAWGRRPAPVQRTSSTRGVAAGTSSTPAAVLPALEKIKNRRFKVDHYTAEVRQMLAEYGLVKGPRTTCQTVLSTISRHLTKKLVLPPLDGPKPPPAPPPEPVTVRQRPNSALLMSELGQRIATSLVNEAYAPQVIAATQMHTDDLETTADEASHLQGTPSVLQRPKPGIEWAELQKGWKAAGLQRHHAQDGALILLEMELGGFHPEFIMAPEKLEDITTGGTAAGGTATSPIKHSTPHPPTKYASREAAAAAKTRANIKAATAKFRLQSAAPDKTVGAVESHLDEDELPSSMTSDLLALRKGQWLAVVMADALLAQLPKTKKGPRGMSVRQKRLMQMIEFFREYKDKFSAMHSGYARGLMSWPSKNGIRIGQAKMELRTKEAHTKWIATYKSHMFAWLNRYLTLGVLPDDEIFNSVLSSAVAAGDLPRNNSSLPHPPSSSPSLPQQDSINPRSSVNQHLSSPSLSMQPRPPTDAPPSTRTAPTSNSFHNQIMSESCELPPMTAGQTTHSGILALLESGGTSGRTGSASIEDAGSLYMRMMGGLATSSGSLAGPISPGGSMTDPGVAGLVRGSPRPAAAYRNITGRTSTTVTDGPTSDELMFGFAQPSPQSVQTHKEFKAMTTAIAQPHHQLSNEIIRLMPTTTLSAHLQGGLSASGSLISKQRYPRVVSRKSVDGVWAHAASLRSSASLAGEAAPNSPNLYNSDAIVRTSSPAIPQGPLTSGTVPYLPYANSANNLAGLEQLSSFSSLMMASSSFGGVPSGTGGSGRLRRRSGAGTGAAWAGAGGASGTAGTAGAASSIPSPLLRTASNTNRLMSSSLSKLTVNASPITSQNSFSQTASGAITTKSVTGLTVADGGSGGAAPVSSGTGQQRGTVFASVQMTGGGSSGLLGRRRGSGMFDVVAGIDAVGPVDSGYGGLRNMGSRSSMGLSSSGALGPGAIGNGGAMGLAAGAMGGAAVSSTSTNDRTHNKLMEGLTLRTSVTSLPYVHRPFGSSSKLF